MSHPATRWAWAAFSNHQGLAATRRIVLLALAECHNQETGRCDPSLDRLIQMTGLKRHTIPPAIRELESIGLISVERGLGQRSSYQLKTSAENGTAPVPKTALPPVPKTALPPVPKTALPPVPKTALKPGIEPGKNQENNDDVVDAREPPEENKQPVTTNPGSEGPHNGDGDEPHDSDAKGIPNDWLPNDRCWELIKQHGIDRQFAELELAAFRLYWSERKELRPWNTAFLSRVRATWQREKERQQVGTNVTPIRPAPSGHRNGGSHFRTFEQMRAENTERAIDEFLGNSNGAIIDVR